MTTVERQTISGRGLNLNGCEQSPLSVRPFLRVLLRRSPRSLSVQFDCDHVQVRTRSHDLNTSRIFRDQGIGHLESRIGDVMILAPSTVFLNEREGLKMVLE